ncbi:hypothetical protein DPX16_16876 [Anabarilius grahami]|uniref:Uncharacterized protein n=1 Tax=Anabarilius grahami TaxID=495550 RepID=A0A3N0XPQ1_ANAGA|nr:hypothetical protein DPX16_16876 [Anabarilius grahami]
MTQSKPECGCCHTLKYGVSEFKNDPQPFKIIRLPFDHPEDVQRFTGQHRYSKYADKGHIDPRRITNHVKGHWGSYPWLGDGKTLWVARGEGNAVGGPRGHRGQTGQRSSSIILTQAPRKHGGEGQEEEEGVSS